MLDPTFVAGTVMVCAAAVMALLILHAAIGVYFESRRAQLDEEFTSGHEPIIRRMRGLTRRGGQMFVTVPAAHGRGWVWIAVDAFHQAMGLARTRRTARRRMNAYATTGAAPDYLMVINRPDKRPPRQVRNPDVPPELADVPELNAADTTLFKDDTA